MGKFKLKRGMGEGGLSIVEVLAALVILSIVFIAFFSFFTQSATFTKHNKEKLTAVQIAEEVVAKVRVIKSLDKFDEMAKLNGYKLTNGVYVNSNSYPDYEVEIKVGTGPVSGLNKAVITVETHTNVGITDSTFKTEMYFDEVKP
ncbi:type II secretion system protein [Sporosarcina sp. E16_3]|uniref:type IV pilus modification PilV family protein n=1 Tax=Sporosarcina sp. E16_3 TaxID=2789293 RepID=UPI001A92B8F4|nr:type II secretion system protein [Sporosarcina sp. E16_3]MBO0601343.1 type II secretion system protein [Sporosarcina sp. E16_3]